MAETRAAALAAVMLAAASALLPGCNTSGCTDNQNALPLAGFYAADTKAAAALASVEIGGVGAPDDSLLVAATQTVQQVYLPLRSGVAQTAFFIRYIQANIGPELYDTVWINYSTSTWFTSEECGAGYRYYVEGLRHTRHFLNSVDVVDPYITNVDKEYLRLYFSERPLPPEPEPDEGDEPGEDGGESDGESDGEEEAPQTPDA